MSKEDLSVRVHTAMEMNLPQVRKVLDFGGTVEVELLNGQRFLITVQEMREGTALPSSIGTQMVLSLVWLELFQQVIDKKSTEVPVPVHVKDMAINFFRNKGIAIQIEETVSDDTVMVRLLWNPEGL